MRCVQVGRKVCVFVLTAERTPLTSMSHMGKAAFVFGNPIHAPRTLTHTQTHTQAEVRRHTERSDAGSHQSISPKDGRRTGGGRD